MKEFVTPLEERLRLGRLYKERYWRDPAFRLRSINRTRQWHGLPPRKSLDEVQSR